MKKNLELHRLLQRERRIAGMDTLTAEDRENGSMGLEYRANRYTSKCMIVMLAALVLIWIIDFLGIFIVDIKLMTIGISVAALIVIATIIFSKCVDLHKPWVKYVMVFLTVAAITVLGVTLTYHTVLLSVLPILLAAQYSNTKVTAYTYILSVVSMFVIVFGGYRWGLCDANMIIQTVTKASYYIGLIVDGTGLSLSPTSQWVTLTLFFFIPRCILLVLLLPVIRSISSNIMEYAEYAAEMKYQSERDEMTGLYNKNHYLYMKEHVYSQEENVGIVFFDVNNLKKTNDTIGHAEGDYLIITTAHMIQHFLEDNREAYRTGGDEFVMVVTNPKEGELEDILYSWLEMERNSRTNSKIPYSAAIGVASGRGQDFESVEKKADERMYRRKQVEKQNEAGTDR